MKLTRKNTALHFLEDNDPVVFFTDENSMEIKMVEKFMHSEFYKLREKFKSKRQLVSEPFFNAFLKAREKLDQVQLEESNKIIQSGTIIKPVATGTNTIFYDLEASGGKGKWDLEGTVIFFNNNNKIDGPIFFSFIHIGKNEMQTCIPKTVANNGITVESCLSDVLSLLLFLKHCELETKVIGVGKKARHVNKKYLNETNSPIEVLDSTYFTTIVRSAGFMVGADTGGFFRYQAYGPNLQYRKWVWIFPFEKEGYERQAKVLGK